MSKSFDHSIDSIFIVISIIHLIHLLDQVIPSVIPSIFYVLSHKLKRGTLVTCFVVCFSQCPCYIAIAQISFAIVVTKFQIFHSFIEEIDTIRT